jgi:hypothetical protein
MASNERKEIRKEKKNGVSLHAANYVDKMTAVCDVGKRKGTHSLNFIPTRIGTRREEQKREKKTTALGSAAQGNDRRVSFYEVNPLP